MQWAYYSNVKRLEPLVKETEDKEFLRMWRYFQASDHLYYMFTAGGGPGEVHSYFSPFGTPIDAYVTAQAAIADFENRVRLAAVAANEPFLFYTGVGKEYFTGTMSWSLLGFVKALQKINVKSLEFHAGNGDFERWTEKSLLDKTMATELKKIRLAKVKGEKLRISLTTIARERFVELNKQLQTTTKYF
jgi:alpha-amylase